MRNAFLVLVCLIPVLGCNLLNQNKTSSNLVDVTRPTPSTATPSPAPSAANANTAAPAKSDLMATLKKSVGKYPYNIELLEIPELKARLKRLMGKDLEEMDEYWNVETPIEISGNILKTSGCEAHNCGGNMYYMIVDTDNDNINIYHQNFDTGNKTYFEKSKIPLPKKFAEDIGVDDK